ncbi:hypothetical protein D9Q98_008986 [Chlorella vulgaris]|uniref:Uncharacterized protein n=1 Tax=Chlorella vulgaris TaxID=3077 RepID=A0A9D4TH13_CHLVU|nr:hypothetical protein D9Q98_008986 [Chlorella vulgaris]
MSVPDTATSQASQAAAASHSAGGSTPSGRFEVGGLWEGAKAWAADAWEEAQGAALARQQAYNAWLDHHWQSFEERVQQRLGDGEEWRAWKEQQRQRWGELAEEGEQLVRREMGVLEKYWQKQYPQASQPQQPASSSFRLSYLLLPLCPSLRSRHPFGQKTKMALVGEMRDTGTRLAGGFRALGSALGGAGTRGK